MTANDMRIALCLQLGWSHIVQIAPSEFVGSLHDDHADELPLPHLTLDFLYEVEESLDAKQRLLFCYRLGPLTSQRAWEYIHVDPLVRAEALLKTLGTWRDDT